MPSLNRFCVCFILVALFCLQAEAQQSPYFTLAQYQLNLINPAYAGSQGDVFTLGTRSQWAAIEGAPNTFTFSYATKRSENVGLGLSVISDKVNIEQQTLAYIDFSYQLTLSSTMRLYLGLKAGGNFFSADPTGLINYMSPADPSKHAMRQFSPNAGIGAYLEAGDFWVSVSAPRLFEIKRNAAEEVFAKDRVHTYMAAGTSLSVNEQFDLMPSVIFRKVMGMPLSTEFTAQIRYMKRFQVGGQIRDISNMGMFAFVNVSPKIDVGYAYDSYLDTELSGMAEKGHEIFLRFRLGKPSDAIEQAQDMASDSSSQGNE